MRGTALTMAFRIVFTLSRYSADMDVRSIISASEDVGRHGLAVSLGVTQADSAYETDSQIALLRRATAMLPAIVLAQFIAIALILAATFALQAYYIGGAATAFSAAGLAISGAMLLFSRTPAFER